ncbi:hypothetical protein Aeqsu_1640 [Aequorivita sublithincola DSM 14238]|uniref:Uncharacterized protein n=1 Tax=Aequorivita sublithincola (strain DSM 14238 / LMG 21431 / ACAM 643 / 9-3) TaxID=746697 RepID=I3YVV6_AEQSU|nr:hypothetical protein [Aequorivita sublithincola]AFL81124.1 hypothetical protein Aeqsu_1640 [Aequorivita sublithincola DSM 14238]
MSTNQALTAEMELALGVSIINRRPLASEIFKWQDIDLLPHSSTDTILCEIFDWNGRNWRTTGKNLIGYLFENNELKRFKVSLLAVPKYEASIPDFEFNKDQIIDLGFNLPSLFNIGFTGNVKNAKELSIKVNKVTKSRITNIDSPGIETMHALSAFSEKESRLYKKHIKSNYLTQSLFYAESVEVSLEKESGVDVGISFDLEGVEVETKVDTNTKKNFKLTYKNALAPFGATFVKGKDF